ncbi:MAG TPA: DNA replication/repair protein RecF [Rudaea sp.]
MVLTELRIENLRNISGLHLRLEPGVNLFTGPNGAGKTSILEAVYLLSHANSFRTRRGEILMRRDCPQLSVFGEVARSSGGTTRLGLTYGDGRWTARVDGRTPDALAGMLEHCAVVCFEPGSHALISGPSDERRRFVDWGVFHVEPSFVEVARRYRRTLRQRNAALRENRGDSEMAVWDEELIAAALPLSEARDRYLQRLAPILCALLAMYLPELGAPELRTSPGWSAVLDLSFVLQGAREVDRQRAHTTRGPHRADWWIRFASAPRREQLSRGQEKLCAIACMLAQAELYRADHAEWPIVVLDDLPSELDQAHQDQVLMSLRSANQILLSSTEIPVSLDRSGTRFRRFHVEQGAVRGLL